MRIGILGAGAALACVLDATTAGAQTAPCDQCAKLDTINLSIEVQTTEVKQVRRAVENLQTAQPTKSAVVIEFGDGVHPAAAAINRANTPDVIATTFCKSINYNAGKALVSRDLQTGGTYSSPLQRQVLRLVCYM